MDTGATQPGVHEQPHQNENNRVREDAIVLILDGDKSIE